MNKFKLLFLFTFLISFCWCGGVKAGTGFVDLKFFDMDGNERTGFFIDEEFQVVYEYTLSSNKDFVQLDPPASSFDNVIDCNLQGSQKVGKEDNKFKYKRIDNYKCCFVQDKQSSQLYMFNGSQAGEKIKFYLYNESYNKVDKAELDWYLQKNIEPLIFINMPFDYITYAGRKAMVEFDLKASSGNDARVDYIKKVIIDFDDGQIQEYGDQKNSFETKITHAYNLTNQSQKKNITITVIDRGDMKKDTSFNIELNALPQDLQTEQDKKAPRISVNPSKMDEDQWKNNLGIKLHFSDDSGVDQVYYYFKQANKKDFESSLAEEIKNKGTKIKTARAFITVPEGKHYLHAWAKDKKGNESVYTRFGPYSIDKTSPTIKSFSIKNNKTSINPNDIIELNWEIEDNLSGIEKITVNRYFWENNKEKWVGPASASINKVSAVSNKQQLSSLGQHKFELVVIDRAGNKAVKQGPIIEVKASDTPPKINKFSLVESLQNRGEWYLNSPIALTWEVEDDDFDRVEIWQRYENGAWYKVDTGDNKALNQKFSSYSFIPKINGQAKAGYWQFKLKAYDKKGNMSENAGKISIKIKNDERVVKNISAPQIDSIKIYQDSQDVTNSTIALNQEYEIKITLGQGGYADYVKISAFKNKISDMAWQAIKPGLTFTARWLDAYQFKAGESFTKKHTFTNSNEQLCAQLGQAPSAPGSRVEQGQSSNIVCISPKFEQIDTTSPEISNFTINKQEITKNKSNDHIKVSFTVSDQEQKDSINYIYIQYKGPEQDNWLFLSDFNPQTPGDYEKIIFNSYFTQIGQWNIRVVAQDNSQNIAYSDLKTIKVVECQDKQNQRPVAKISEISEPVLLGQVVNLDGSNSYDKDGDAITYSWRFKQTPLASTAVIKNNYSSQAQFTPDKSGQYIVQLSVESNGQSSIDKITINVEKPSLKVDFSANTQQGQAPFTPEFTVKVSGTATGKVKAQIDCTSDNTYDKEQTKLCDNNDCVLTFNNCTYLGTTNRTVKLKVERGYANPVEKILSIASIAKDSGSSKPEIKKFELDKNGQTINIGDQISLYWKINNFTKAEIISNLNKTANGRNINAYKINNNQGTYDFSIDQPGQWQFRIKAYNGQGQTIESQVKTVTVEAPGPQITSFKVSAGTKTGTPSKPLHIFKGQKIQFGYSAGNAENSSVELLRNHSQGEWQSLGSSLDDIPAVGVWYYKLRICKDDKCDDSDNIRVVVIESRAPNKPSGLSLGTTNVNDPEIDVSTTPVFTWQGNGCENNSELVKERAGLYVFNRNSREWEELGLCERGAYRGEKEQTCALADFGLGDGYELDQDALYAWQVRSWTESNFGSSDENFYTDSDHYYFKTLKLDQSQDNKDSQDKQEQKQEQDKDLGNKKKPSCNINDYCQGYEFAQCVNAPILNKFCSYGPGGSAHDPLDYVYEVKKQASSYKTDCGNQVCACANYTKCDYGCVDGECKKAPEPTSQTEDYSVDNTYPGDNAVNVELNPVFKWSSKNGYNAVALIHGGSIFSQCYEFKGPVSGNNYQCQFGLPLDPNTSYRWCVFKYNGGEYFINGYGNKHCTQDSGNWHSFTTTSGSSSSQVQTQTTNQEQNTNQQQQQQQQQTAQGTNLISLVYPENHSRNVDYKQMPLVLKWREADNVLSRNSQAYLQVNNEPLTYCSGVADEETGIFSCKINLELSPNTSYNWRVKYTYNQDGLKKSAYSDWFYFTTKSQSTSAGSRFIHTAKGVFDKFRSALENIGF